MHGNIRQLVCVQCRGVQQLCAASLKRLKAKQPIPCPSCSGGPAMRCRVMLYDDAEGAHPNLLEGTGRKEHVHIEQKELSLQPALAVVCLACKGTVLGSWGLQAQCCRSSDVLFGCRPTWTLPSHCLGNRSWSSDACAG